MNITLFELYELDKTASYEISRGKDGGLESSALKWKEAYYLIQRGYTLRGMGHKCGLCFLYFDGSKVECPGCPIKFSHFCKGLDRIGLYFPGAPEDKDKVQQVRWRSEHLQKLVEETT